VTNPSIPIPIRGVTNGGGGGVAVIAIVSIVADTATTRTQIRASAIPTERYLLTHKLFQIRAAIVSSNEHLLQGAPRRRNRSTHSQWRRHRHGYLSQQIRERERVKNGEGNLGVLGFVEFGRRA